MEGGGEDMEMEVEQFPLTTASYFFVIFEETGNQKLNPNQLRRRRLCLSNRFQENSTLAVSLSSKSIKFYSPATGQYLGECKGHYGPINQISFSTDPSSPNLLHSCSSDGTIRSWDTRTFAQVSLFNAGSSQEVFSFSLGGSTSNLLAAGCKSEVIDKVQEETNKSRSDRKPPGVGRGRGRGGREDSASGRPAKGIGRGDDGGRGMGGGRGRGGPNNKSGGSRGGGRGRG